MSNICNGSKIMEGMTGMWQSEQMPQEYHVRYLDTKYVFDSNGIVKWVDVNPLEYSKAKQVLEPLLA